MCRLYTCIKCLLGCYPGRRREGKTLILHSSAAGFTCLVSVWLLGFPVRRRVTPPHRPCIRLLFVNSEVCLKASSPPQLAVTQLPSANGSGHTARRGLSPPRSVPCLAHVVDHRKRPTGVTHLLQQSPQVPSMMYGVEAQQALERYDRAWLAVIPGPSAELVPAEALAGC